MQRALFLIVSLAAAASWADAPPAAPPLIAKPNAFDALLHPNCSHCVIEGKRREADLRPDDRVLSWMQVQADGYINDGAIPLRFFLSTHRILDDGWGLFVYDPDAGFARGFAPGGGPWRFHGWRNGVMVIRSPDGTLYSALSGLAFDGPNKGHRLQPEPTLVTDWGFWQKRYPQAVAFTMYDKFKPVDLPTEVNDDSRKSRGPADDRLPANTMVLGVWDRTSARAYPLDALEKAGVVHETVEGQPRVVLWYGPTKTAAAFRQPWGTSGLQGDAGWIFSVHSDQSAHVAASLRDATMSLGETHPRAAPFVDQRLGIHWDITGRPQEGGPRLVWMESVQVKWYAWAAEYPKTTVYGK
jgi:Protein of unknown function (DUF3179)